MRRSAVLIVGQRPRSPPASWPPSAPSARATARRPGSCSIPRPTTPTSTRSPRPTPRTASRSCPTGSRCEEPAGGPYFGKLDPRARYYVKIDNTGDGYEDVAYRWQFKNRFRNPNSFLYAAPTVDSVNDPDLNFVQTYDLFKETYKNRHLVRTKQDRLRRPGRAGQRRAEDDPQLRPGRGRRRSRRCAAAARRSSVRVDDPFFVDLGAVFDGINIDKPGRPNIGLGNQGGGKRRRVGLQRPLVRPAGARARGHGRRPCRLRPEGRQRGRRRVVDHRAPPRLGARPPQAATAAGGCRSAASATR